MDTMKISKQITPERIYDQILNTNGKVVGKDLIDSVQVLQEQTQ